MLTRIYNYVTTMLTKLKGPEAMYSKDDMTKIANVQSLEQHLKEISAEKPKPRRGRPKKDK